MKSALPFIFAAASTPVAYLPLLTESLSGFSQLNFRWRNQRQERKNRRRAHAAGFKNAFA